MSAIVSDCVWTHSCELFPNLAKVKNASRSLVLIYWYACAISLKRLRFCLFHGWLLTRFVFNVYARRISRVQNYISAAIKWAEDEGAIPCLLHGHHLRGIKSDSVFLSQLLM